MFGNIATKSRSWALLLILALVLWREIAVHFEIHHFQPYLAFIFCFAAFRKASWAVLLGGVYAISTIMMTGGQVGIWFVAILFSFVAIGFLGSAFKSIQNPFARLGGSFAGATIFYLVTNFASWLTIPAYPRSLEGLNQALWSGLPGYAPTWTFFRNDLVSTLLFTCLFLVLFHRTSPSRRKEASTLGLPTA